MDFLLQI